MGIMSRNNRCLKSKVQKKGLYIHSNIIININSLDQILETEVPKHYHPFKIDEKKQVDNLPNKHDFMTICQIKTRSFKSILSY